MKTKTTLTLSTLTAAALLAACATAPAPTQELIAARSAVRSAELDPNVLNYAPLELKKATDTLNRANALDVKGDAPAEVASAAYVAERQARVAMAVAKAKGNDEAIKGAEVERERARADARAADARRAQGQAATARADATTARADATMARDQAATAQQQADAARTQATAAQASAAESQRQAAALQAQLGDMQAQQTERGMLVTLGDVLFEFGQANVKPGAQESLRKLAAYLQQRPERNVLIEGFTDSVGSESANMALSQRRAEAVASALTAMGVAPGRVAAKGYGKSYPIADNSTDTNRALNRRVEVYISDTDKPVRARG